MAEEQQEENLNLESQNNEPLPTSGPHGVETVTQKQLGESHQSETRNDDQVYSKKFQVISSEKSPGHPEYDEIISVESSENDADVSLTGENNLSPQSSNLSDVLADNLRFATSPPPAQSLNISAEGMENGDDKQQKTNQISSSDNEEQADPVPGPDDDINPENDFDDESDEELKELEKVCMKTYGLKKGTQEFEYIFTETGEQLICDEKKKYKESKKQGVPYQYVESDKSEAVKEGKVDSLQKDEDDDECKPCSVVKITSNNDTPQVSEGSTSNGGKRPFKIPRNDKEDVPINLYAPAHYDAYRDYHSKISSQTQHERDPNQDYPGIYQDYPGVYQDYPGAYQDYPGAYQDYPRLPHTAGADEHLLWGAMNYRQTNAPHHIHMGTGLLAQLSSGYTGYNPENVYYPSQQAVYIATPRQATEPQTLPVSDQGTAAAVSSETGPGKDRQDMQLDTENGNSGTSENSNSRSSFSDIPPKASQVDRPNSQEDESNQGSLAEEAPWDKENGLSGGRGMSPVGQILMTESETPKLEQDSVPSTLQSQIVHPQTVPSSVRAPVTHADTTSVGSRSRPQDPMSPRQRPQGIPTKGPVPDLRHHPVSAFHEADHTRASTTKHQVPYIHNGGMNGGLGNALHLGQQSQAMPSTVNPEESVDSLMEKMIQNQPLPEKSWMELVEMLEKQHHEQLMAQYKQHQQRMQLLQSQIESQLVTRSPPHVTKVSPHASRVSPQIPRVSPHVTRSPPRGGMEPSSTQTSHGYVPRPSKDAQEVPDTGPLPAQYLMPSRQTDPTLQRPIDTNESLSSTYSNFSYWKGDEDQMYQKLPGQTPPTRMTIPPMTPSQQSSVYFPTPTKSEIDNSEKLQQQLREQHRTRASEIHHQSVNDKQSPMDDPRFASDVRVNLREKHARHLMDLRAYYEQEIESLKQQLAAPVDMPPSPFQRLQEENKRLQNKCEQADTILGMASEQIKILEQNISMLEYKLNTWPVKYQKAEETITALQIQYEEMSAFAKQKGDLVLRLETKNSELNAALEEAYRLQDIKTTNVKQENDMTQKLLHEYETLGKEHEIIKKNLNETDNKLYDAKEESSKLKKQVSKLEIEVQRLSRENDLLRYKGLTSTGFTRSPSHISPGIAPRINISLNDSNTESPSTHRLYTVTDPTSKTLRDFGAKSASQSYVDSETRAAFSYPKTKNATPPRVKETLFVDSDSGGDDRPLSPMLKAEREFERRKRAQTARRDSNDSGQGKERKSLFPWDLYPEASRADRDGPDGAHTSNQNKTKTPEKRTPSGDSFSGEKQTTQTQTPDINYRQSGTSSKESQTPEKQDVYSSFSRKPTDDIILNTSERTKMADSRKSWSGGKKAVTGNQSVKSGQGMLSPNSSYLKTTPVDSKKSRRTPTSPKSKNSSPGSITPKQSPKKKGDKDVDTTLSKIKSGTYVARPEWENQDTTLTKKKHQRAPITEKAITERMKVVSNLEKRFDELLVEKRVVESSLSHLPSSSSKGRLNRETRQNKEDLEKQLDQIDRELGSVRMALKRYNVLKIPH